MNENQENLLDHYVNPRNYNKKDIEIDSTVKLLNTSCGDEINVSIKVKDNKISDVTFTGEGCSIAIGTASILYETLLGKDLTEILGIAHDYPETLIGIPLTISRKKCATLPLEAIKDAIRQYTKDNS